MRWIVMAFVMAAAVPAAPGAPKKAASLRVLRTGTNRSFQFGGVRYLVREVNSRERFAVRGAADVLAPAGAKFVTVWYTVENIGANPIWLLPNEFYLRDGKGRRYTPNMQAQELLGLSPSRDAEMTLNPVDLQPGVVQGLLTGFVLPDDAIGAGLRIYFPADRKPYDFIEVWPSNDHPEQEVTEARE